MQVEAAGFTREDLSKYPFLKQASREIEELGFTINNLVSLENKPVLDRARNQLEKAISELHIGQRTRDKQTEISAFAAALIFVIATKNNWVKKRYALAVAKSAYVEMLNEKEEKILAIANDFDWDINSGLPHKDFRLGFNFYLKNAAHMHGLEWKLINQIMDKGCVYLNKDKIVRLLQEEIKTRVEKRLDVPELKNLPEEINLIAHEIAKLASEVMGQEIEEMPKEVVQTAFPPCINALYVDAAANHHLSHIGRFTLTSFLVNIGMTPESVNEFFKTFSDYNERLARYQIEHIAGERGSGTKYTCPQCSVLQTHGVCKNRDDLCRRIYHPLRYYLLKQKMKTSA